MKSYIKAFLFYIIYWYAYFVICRLFFMIYHFDQAKTLSSLQWFCTIIYGFKLDLSTIGYILVIPIFITLFTAPFKINVLKYFIPIYTLILLIVFSFLIVVDFELYTSWGFRLDSTPLLYVDHPQTMLASVSTLTIVKLLFLTLLIILAFYYFYRKFMHRWLPVNKPDWKLTIVLIIFLPFQFLMIRGTTDLQAISVSSAYFSQSQFANHSAINPIWNLVYSITESKNASHRYIFMKPADAAHIFNDLYRDSGNTSKILRTLHPNIIIIVIESFTAKAIEPLGGLKGITPNFNHLIHEGVLFDHFFASGDRTDRAMTSILGCFPPLPTTSIIRFPSKTEKLSYISKELIKKNYHTAFYYGGSLSFVNFSSFLICADFQKVVSDVDFDKSTFNSKWGAWDHVVLQRLLDETPDNENSFFKVLFTLTSHEPFEIPIAPRLKGNSTDTKFLNSLIYTDQCLGDFITQAKKKKWWDNTLIILVADHSTVIPGNTPNEDLAKFKIPMLWLGGALSVKDTIIHKFSSQTDIARTVLSQINIHPKGFDYSKDIFSPSSLSFAFYVFNNGFGFVNDSCKLIYDNNAHRYIDSSQVANDRLKSFGKAYLQYIFEDFTKK